MIAASDPFPSLSPALQQQLLTVVQYKCDNLYVQSSAFKIQGCACLWTHSLRTIES
jgi:hypothetical protein